jgi:hypothetical protein
MLSRPRHRLDPFELGRLDAKSLIDGTAPKTANNPCGLTRNPFPEFSAKWGLYNRGFNSWLPS